MSSVKLRQLNNTRSTGHEGNATIFVLNKHRVERRNNIDDETQGVLDSTLKFGENKEDGGFTLIKVERMVNL